MMLANVAWILASHGWRVLTVDWDLEAPGLHKYFQKFLLDPELTASPGVVDLVWDFAAAASVPSVDAVETSPAWYQEHADILRYVVALQDVEPSNPKPPDCLHFMPAGKHDPAYGLRVNSFNWQTFYDRLGGGVFLEAVKERMRQEYDYILIDSRTGVSDTSGICTVQMPDDLVLCFTPNDQNIEGASAVATSVREQWQSRGEKISVIRKEIFPVLMRVDNSEKERLDKARDRARERFSAYIELMNLRERESYWSDVEVPYVPWYSFEEELAVLRDRPNEKNTILDAAEHLSGYLSRGEVRELNASGFAAETKKNQGPMSTFSGEALPLDPNVLDTATEYGRSLPMVAVLGFAGSGKSFLVNRLRQTLEDSGHWRVLPSPAPLIPFTPEGLELTYVQPVGTRPAWSRAQPLAGRVCW